MNGIEANGLAIVLPMLWVIGLMVAVGMTVISKHKNERMSKRIGIELELIKKLHLRDSPHERMALWIDRQVKSNDSLLSAKTKKLLKRISIRYDGYTHEVMNRTKLVTDSSLSSGGFEIVSPPLSGDYDQRSWLSRISSALRGVAGVDSSTSAHIHVGLKDYESGEWLVKATGMEWSDYDVAKAICGNTAYAYGYFQTVLNKMVSPSRRDGRWSKDVRYLPQMFEDISPMAFTERKWDVDEDRYITNVVESDDNIRIGLHFFETLLEGGGRNDSRYQCVNPLAVQKYGTIEFRSHQGTTNAAKLQNWIDIVYLLTSRCASESWADITQYNGESYHDFMAYLGVSPNDHMYLTGIRRIRSLNGSDPSVFAHDPSIAHSAMFQAIPTCTKCGKVTCDHDTECGVNYSEILAEEIKEHFSNLSYPERNCDECCTNVMESNSIEREYTQHTEAYCNECDCWTNFSAFGGLVLSVAMGVIPLALVVVGCGIGAIHAVSKRFKAKKMSSKLFKALSARGKQASGFAFDNGEGVYYVKAPHSSVAMAHHMGKQLNRNTMWTMMHTRYATHGVNNKANAHPHLGRNGIVTMVHNGVVHNHNSVWTALDEKPTGPVDSQAVAQCLELGGIEKVVEHCEGSMSLIWSDNRDPQGTIKCWTNGGNPLVMGRLDRADGPVAIASTLALLKQGVGKRLFSEWDCVVGREYTINPNGTVTKRDIDGSEETAGVSYDWRTYKIDEDYYSTSGKSNPPNYTVIKHSPRPNYRVIKLARDKMSKTTTGGFLPIEGKWHGYDAVEHKGISPDKWDYKGAPMEYELPQWLVPSVYEEDLVALLRGDHAPAVDDNKAWDLCGLDDYDYQL